MWPSALRRHAASPPLPALLPTKWTGPSLLLCKPSLQVSLGSPVHHQASHHIHAERCSLSLSFLSSPGQLLPG